jgi:predicted nucleic acid-binding protein
MTRERVVIDTNVLISGLVSTTSTPPLAVEKAITKAQLVRFCSQVGLTFWVEV